MKKQIRKVSNGLVTGACAVLGGMYFVTDSVGELILHAEAVLIRNRDGVETDVTKNNRVNTCSAQQGKVLDKVDEFFKFMDKAKQKVSTEIETLTCMTYGEDQVSNLKLVKASVIIAEQ